MSYLEKVDQPVRESRFRTLIHVKRVIGSNPETARVQALLSGWGKRRRLTMPLNSLPEGIQQQIEPDTILFAQVNLAAEKGSQLKPTDIQLGPTQEEVDEMFDRDPDLAWLKTGADELYPHGFWKADEWNTGLMFRKYPDGSIHEIERIDTPPLPRF
jgi:hypothetical protein